jgi:hypothetical protein
MTNRLPRDGIGRAQIVPEYVIAHSRRKLLSEGDVIANIFKPAT